MWYYSNENNKNNTWDSWASDCFLFVPPFSSLSLSLCSLFVAEATARTDKIRMVLDERRAGASWYLVGGRGWWHRR